MNLGLPEALLFMFLILPLFPPTWFVAFLIYIILMVLNQKKAVKIFLWFCLIWVVISLLFCLVAWLATPK